ncbi:hypothetical protein KY290_007092 [Solanum tuberosum]|uniref:Uncharacterized protein n=1 Tax=Solanum tuberosum TaxID=4113 RepID=A0ABQ7W5X5_SOLTU|nr:hypothetical protein KY290_007092 [Solanum tuberosum]
MELIMNIHITINLALKFAFISTIVTIALWWCFHIIIRRRGRNNHNIDEHEAPSTPTINFVSMQPSLEDG